MCVRMCRDLWEETEREGGVSIFHDRREQFISLKNEFEKIKNKPYPYSFSFEQ